MPALRCQVMAEVCTVCCWSCLGLCLSQASTPQLLAPHTSSEGGNEVHALYWLGDHSMVMECRVLHLKLAQEHFLNILGVFLWLWDAFFVGWMVVKKPSSRTRMGRPATSVQLQSTKQSEGPHIFIIDSSITLRCSTGFRYSSVSAWAW